MCRDLLSSSAALVRAGVCSPWSLRRPRVTIEARTSAAQQPPGRRARARRPRRRRPRAPAGRSRACPQDVASCVWEKPPRSFARMCSTVSQRSTTSARRPRVSSRAPVNACSCSAAGMTESTNRRTASFNLLGLDLDVGAARGRMTAPLEASHGPRCRVAWARLVAAGWCLQEFQDRVESGPRRGNRSPTFPS
jgi:hypothetical protein